MVRSRASLLIHSEATLAGYSTAVCRVYMFSGARPRSPCVEQREKLRTRRFGEQANSSGTVNVGFRLSEPRVLTLSLHRAEQSESESWLAAPWGSRGRFVALLLRRFGDAHAHPCDLEEESIASTGFDRSLIR